MEKAWCGARGKVMKGANTVFAQDGESNVIMYTRADILRREEAAEIKKFISYWQRVNGKVNETLVFDGKFTKYSVLDELTDMGIRFVTLRRRFASLLDQTDKTPSDEWERVHLSIPKRKYNNLLVHEGSVALKHCTKPLRQIIVKGNGRANFTYILTNNMGLSRRTVLEIYAKRWHIENKLSELVSFFNLNTLSSPFMIRIHFDILWTIIADTPLRWI